MREERIPTQHRVSHDARESGNSSHDQGSLGAQVCHLNHPNTWNGFGPLPGSRLSVAVGLAFPEIPESQKEHWEEKAADPLMNPGSWSGRFVLTF